MDDTTLDDYYTDAELTFSDVFAVVKYKMLNKQPMSTAREEFLEDVIVEAIEIFGNNFVFGE